MKKYIGVKVVSAEPAKATKDYGTHKAGEDGYKVIYKDGYESWSPKDVFEEAYKELDSFLRSNHNKEELTYDYENQSN